MTNQQHPITPPPDLIEQWLKEFYGAKVQHVAEASIHLAARAAQWGADQELEACCEWLDDTYDADPEDTVPELRTARRPKPSSLKEQALAALERYEAEEWCEEMTFDSNIIRRALESLPN